MTTKPTPLLSHPDFNIWNKPENMSVHNESPSLIEYIQGADQNSKNSSDLPSLHFLNRLDRETSGLVVQVLKTDKVASYQTLWQSEETIKIYLGIHRLSPKLEQKRTTWNWPLTDQAEGFRNPQGISKNRQSCETEFIPLEVTRHLLASMLILKTGRQHQIRKHSVLAGCELIGDSRYGEPRYQKNLKVHMPDLRLGLHCYALHWTVDNKPLRVKTEIPEFYEKLFPNLINSANEILETV